MNCCLFLVVINGIYLHHNLEGLFVLGVCGIERVQDKGRKPGLVNACTYLQQK